MKKKKKLGNLNVKIHGGTEMSSEIASAFEARQQNLSDEGRNQTSNEWRQKQSRELGGPLVSTRTGKTLEEMHPDLASGKRNFIPRTETNPEEFVETGQGLVTPETALISEQMRQQESIGKEEQEGDFASEFLRKVPLVGEDIEGARNVLGKGFSTISGLFGADEQTKRDIEQSFGLEPGQSFFKDDDVQSFGISLAAVGIGGFLFRGIGSKLATKGIVPQGLKVDKFGKAAGFTAQQTSALAKKIGFKRIDLAAEKLIKMNTPMIQKVLASGWTKLGVGAASGVALTTGWLASDNILSGSNFTAKLVQDSVESGVISKAEGLSLMNEIQEWNDGAESFIRGRNLVDPLTWGALGKPYLINAEKAQRDLALRRAQLLSQ